MPQPSTPTDQWRPDLYVLARFLDRLWHAPEAPAPVWTKSRLQASVGVNYDVFQRYLVFLEENELVRIVPGDHGEKRVELLAKGREAHGRLVRWIEDVFGPKAFGRR